MKWRWKVAQAAEIRWWQNYLKKRPKAEYLDWKRQYWKGFLQEMKIEVPPKARCLDAGCGPAGIFSILQQQEVVAIDPLLDQYAEKLPHFQASDYPYCQFKTAPLEQFEDSEGFDWIFCLNAINHVADLELALQQLKQLLHPGGKLLLSIDAHNYRLFKYIFRLLPGDILHPHQHDLQDYQQLVENLDLKITQHNRMNSGFFFDYYALLAQNS